MGGKGAAASKSATTLVLGAYAVVGAFIGLFLLGAGRFGALIGFGILSGSLFVGAGALTAWRNPHRGGTLVAGGAMLSSASLGLLFYYWDASTTNWGTLLFVVGITMVVVGGIPILIGGALIRWGTASSRT